MQNIIIGTAGHIDHGKTTLIKAITGRETDRLKEEKERGISIDLGFTYFDLPSGRRAGIVDVPGHEKFIKNMLAGVGGIDIVVLVIAADEGIMPQTQEHLNILQLLEVKRGIIALTKIDMVEEDWLELVKEDIREAIQGTFLEYVPIVPVSSTQGIGIQELILTMDGLTKNLDKRDINKPFRVPIDRVFTITGFGTVVTGTLIEGVIKEGETAGIYPGGKEVKIRSLQVHDTDVKYAQAGQRVAINISNLKKGEVSRGDVLAPIGSLPTSMMLDGEVELLTDSPFSINNRERVRVYHGTSEILARIILLDREELKPGQKCFVQLRLEENISAKPLDRFILRFYSPMITIGGGIILDANPPKRKRFKEDVIQELSIKKKGDSKDILNHFLSQYSKEFLSLEEISRRTGILIQDVIELSEDLVDENVIIKISQGNDIYLFHMDFIDDLSKRIVSFLTSYHSQHPLKAGAPKEEIRSRFFREERVKVIEELFKVMEERGSIKMKQDTIAKFDFTIQLSKEQERIAENIEKEFLKGGVNPPRWEELIRDPKDLKEHRQVFEALNEWGTLIKINEEIYFHQKVYHTILEALKEYFLSHTEINVAAFRDLLGTSRKYAIALLEHFDQRKITRRIGDNRISNI